MGIIREKEIGGEDMKTSSYKKKNLKALKHEEILHRKRIPFFIFNLGRLAKSRLLIHCVRGLWRNGDLHCWCKQRKNKL